MTNPSGVGRCFACGGLINFVGGTSNQQDHHCTYGRDMTVVDLGTTVTQTPFGQHFESVRFVTSPYLTPASKTKES